MIVLVAPLWLASASGWLALVLVYELGHELARLARR